jgi:hypothetical protein
MELVVYDVVTLALVVVFTEFIVPRVFYLFVIILYQRVFPLLDGDSMKLLPGSIGLCATLGDNVSWSVGNGMVKFEFTT